MLDYILDIIQPQWAEFINVGIRAWNGCVNAALVLLYQTPEEVGNGRGWHIVETVTGSVLYQTAAATLVVVFFLYGLSKSSLDFGKNFDIRHMVSMLLPLCLAETVILNYTAVLRALFGMSVAMAKGTALLNGGVAASGEIDPMLGYVMDVQMWMGSLGGSILESVLVTVLAFIVMLAMMACGVGLLLTVYGRIFRLLIMIPFGCFALPAAASGNAMSTAMERNPASSFVRILLACLLEPVAITLAIYIGAGVLSDAHIFSSLLAPEDFGYNILYVLDILLVSVSVTGLAKGADNMMQRIFG